MKALSLRLIARAPLVLGPLVTTFIACEPRRLTPPPPRIEAKEATIDPDDAHAIPCGPRRVLEGVCQRCHQNPPVNGAPFPLVTRSNIVRVGPDGEIRELMIQEIEIGRMPLSPVTIDYDSRELLLDWLHSGAPATPNERCDEEGPDAGAASDGDEPSSRPPQDADDETNTDIPPDAAASD